MEAAGETLKIVAELGKLDAEQSIFTKEYVIIAPKPTDTPSIPLSPLAVHAVRGETAPRPPPGFPL